MSKLRPVGQIPSATFCKNSFIRIQPHHCLPLVSGYLSSCHRSITASKPKIFTSCPKTKSADLWWRARPDLPAQLMLPHQENHSSDLYYCRLILPGFELCMNGRLWFLFTQHHVWDSSMLCGSVTLEHHHQRTCYTVGILCLVPLTAECYPDTGSHRVPGALWVLSLSLFLPHSLPPSLTQSPISEP